MNESSTDQKFEFEDIGPKTISYLAEGLYPDLRDPIREYVQNGVDAKATDVAILVSGNSITIENNGQGMDTNDLRHSLRIAISEKDPIKDVGYKGIGIYSGMLISQKVTIKSRKNDMCSQLILNFNKMGDLIDQNLSLPEVINGATTVEPIEDFSFFDKALEGDGTQVELTGIRSELKHLFSKDALSEYLKNTLPLSFNPNFCHAEKIDEKIREVSDKTGYAYRTVPLHLTVNGDRTTLYRPYELVATEIFEPHYEFVQFPVSEIETKFALIWGCLNKRRRVIQNERQRGFRIKQKGFTIGGSNTVLPFFPNRGKHANRYIGEIVILSNHIKANTARSDIAHTEHSQDFRRQLKKVAVKYEKFSNTHQESSMALEECGSVESQLQSSIEAPTADGIDRLKRGLKSLKNRLKQPIDVESRSRVNELIQQLESRIPELERKLSELKGDDSTGTTSGAASDTGGEQSETDNEGDSDTDEDGGNTSSSIKKWGLKQNLEVTRILDKLNKEGGQSPPEARKIRQLYGSLCTIAIAKHPSLAYIGTWALWETIGAVLSADKPKLEAWNCLENSMAVECQNGNIDRQKYKGMKPALQNILDDGNVNKHSPIGVAEEGVTLRNKMELLDDFFLLVMKQIYKKLTGSDWDNSNSSKDS